MKGSGCSWLPVAAPIWMLADRLQGGGGAGRAGPGDPQHVQHASPVFAGEIRRRSGPCPGDAHPRVTRSRKRTSSIPSPPAPSSRPTVSSSAAGSAGGVYVTDAVSPVRSSKRTPSVPAAPPPSDPLGGRFPGRGGARRAGRTAAEVRQASRRAAAADRSGGSRGPARAAVLRRRGQVVARGRWEDRTPEPDLTDPHARLARDVGRPEPSPCHQRDLRHDRRICPGQDGAVADSHQVDEKAGIAVVSGRSALPSRKSGASTV